MASTPGDDLASHVNNGECLPRAVTVGTQEREIGAGRGGCGCNCGSMWGDEEQRASGTTGAMGAAHGPGGFHTLRPPSAAAVFWDDEEKGEKGGRGA